MMQLIQILVFLLLCFASYTQAQTYYDIEDGIRWCGSDELISGPFCTQLNTPLPPTYDEGHGEPVAGHVFPTSSSLPLSALDEPSMDYYSMYVEGRSVNANEQPWKITVSLFLNQDRFDPTGSASNHYHEINMGARYHCIDPCAAAFPNPPDASVPGELRHTFRFYEDFVWSNFSFIIPDPNNCGCDTVSNLYLEQWLFVLYPTAAMNVETEYEISVTATPVCNGGVYDIATDSCSLCPVHSLTAHEHCSGQVETGQTSGARHLKATDSYGAPYPACCSVRHPNVDSNANGDSVFARVGPLYGNNDMTGGNSHEFNQINVLEINLEGHMDGKALVVTGSPVNYAAETAFVLRATCIAAPTGMPSFFEVEDVHYDNECTVKWYPDPYSSSWNANAYAYSEYDEDTGVYMLNHRVTWTQIRKMREEVTSTCGCTGTSDGNDIERLYLYVMPRANADEANNMYTPLTRFFDLSLTWMDDLDVCTSKTPNEYGDSWGGQDCDQPLRELKYDTPESSWLAGFNTALEDSRADLYSLDITSAYKYTKPDEPVRIILKFSDVNVDEMVSSAFYSGYFKLHVESFSHGPSFWPSECDVWGQNALPESNYYRTAEFWPEQDTYSIVFTSFRGDYPLCGFSFNKTQNAMEYLKVYQPDTFQISADENLMTFNSNDMTYTLTASAQPLCGTDGGQIVREFGSWSSRCECNNTRDYMFPYTDCNYRKCCSQSINSISYDTADATFTPSTDSKQFDETSIVLSRLAMPDLSYFESNIGLHFKFVTDVDECKEPWSDPTYQPVYVSAHASCFAHQPSHPLLDPTATNDIADQCWLFGYALHGGKAKHTVNFTRDEITDLMSNLVLEDCGCPTNANVDDLVDIFIRAEMQTRNEIDYLEEERNCHFDVSVRPIRKESVCENGGVLRDCCGSIISEKDPFTAFTKSDLYATNVPCEMTCAGNHFFDYDWNNMVEAPEYYYGGDESYSIPMYWCECADGFFGRECIGRRHSMSISDAFSDDVTYLSVPSDAWVTSAFPFYSDLQLSVRLDGKIDLSRLDLDVLFEIDELPTENWNDFDFQVTPRLVCQDRTVENYICHNTPTDGAEPDFFVRPRVHEDSDSTFPGGGVAQRWNYYDVGEGQGSGAMISLRGWFYKTLLEQALPYSPFSYNWDGPVTKDVDVGFKFWPYWRDYVWGSSSDWNEYEEPWQDADRYNMEELQACGCLTDNVENDNAPVYAIFSMHIVYWGSSDSFASSGDLGFTITPRWYAHDEEDILFEYAQVLTPEADQPCSTCSYWCTYVEMVDIDAYSGLEKFEADNANYLCLCADASSSTYNENSLKAAGRYCQETVNNGHYHFARGWDGSFPNEYEYPRSEWFGFAPYSHLFHNSGNGIHSQVLLSDTNTALNLEVDLLVNAFDRVTTLYEYNYYSVPEFTDDQFDLVHQPRKYKLYVACSFTDVFVQHSMEWQDLERIQEYGRLPEGYQYHLLNVDCLEEDGCFLFEYNFEVTRPETLDPQYTMYKEGISIDVDLSDMLAELDGNGMLYISMFLEGAVGGSVCSSTQNYDWNNCPSSIKLNDGQTVQTLSFTNDIDDTTDPVQVRLKVVLQDSLGTLLGSIALVCLICLGVGSTFMAFFKSRKKGCARWVKEDVLETVKQWDNLAKIERMKQLGFHESEILKKGKEDPLPPPPDPVSSGDDHENDAEPDAKHGDADGKDENNDSAEGLLRAESLSKSKTVLPGNVNADEDDDEERPVSSKRRRSSSRARRGSIKRSPRSSVGEDQEEPGKRKKKRRSTKAKRKSKKPKPEQKQMDDPEEKIEETNPPVTPVVAFGDNMKADKLEDSEPIKPLPHTLSQVANLLDTPQEDDHSKNPAVTKPLPLVILFLAGGCFLGIIITAFIVMFNISMLHSNMKGVLNVVDLDVLRFNIDEFMFDINFGIIATFFAGFADMFDAFQFIKGVGLTWNCGGAISMFSPLSLLLGAALLLLVLQKDLLLRTAITLRGRAKGGSAMVKKGVAMGLTVGLIYILQAAILSLTDVVIASWGVQRSCTPFDRSLVVVGQYFCIVIIIIFLYFAILLFSGLKGTKLKNFTVDWVKGAFDLIQISLGFWTKSTVNGFYIMGRAEKFDNDWNDDDNQQETVLSLIGQSRGLVWLPIPMGVVLTKGAQYLNNPPVLVFGMSDEPKFSLHTPLVERVIRWILNVAQFVLTILVVVTGRRDMILYLTISVVLSQVLLYTFIFVHIVELRKKAAALKARKSAHKVQDKDNLSATDTATTDDVVTVHVQKD